MSTGLTHWTKTNIYLEMRLDSKDIKHRSLEMNFYTDADHAYEFSRKSISGAALMIEGEFSTAMVDF